MDQVHARVGPLVQQLEEACEAIDRDPATLERTFDLYGVAPPASSGASAAEVADSILALGALGFTEVRCDLTDKTLAGIESMASVVELVHAG